MNLSQFLKKVEEISNVCSEEQLKEFIREAARVLPEFQREDFLSRLKQISGENTRKNKIFPPVRLSMDFLPDYASRKDF